MFKIAFPWAQLAEEKAERDYLKTIDATSQDEVAGNVWVEPSFGRFKSLCPYPSPANTRRSLRASK
jgi:hypothetical protein